MRLLVVNGDDFGLAHGVNEGIIAAHTHGILTSASLMVGTPAASQAAELARAHPELSIGLHFDETFYQQATPGQIAGYVDEERAWLARETEAAVDPEAHGAIVPQSPRRWEAEQLKERPLLSLGE